MVYGHQMFAVVHGMLDDRGDPIVNFQSAMDWIDVAMVLAHGVLALSHGFMVLAGGLSGPFHGSMERFHGVVGSFHGGLD